MDPYGKIVGLVDSALNSVYMREGDMKVKADK